MRRTNRRLVGGDCDAQAVKVFCRIKPNYGDLPSCIEIINNQTIKVSGKRSGISKESLHTFSAVHNEAATQEDIFEGVAFPLVSNLFDGKDGLLLAYGTTGSGKTYAMQGNSKHGGILSFCFDAIFNSIDNRQAKKYVVKPDGLNSFDIQSESSAIMDRHRLDYQQRLRNPRSEVSATIASRPHSSACISLSSKALYTVFVSLIEVYNNCVFDLLQESSDTTGRTLITHVLREDVQRKIYASGSLVVEVRSTDEALRVLNNGLKRRRTGQTSLNLESSRSHCVFIIRLVRTGYDEKYDEVIQDKNLLVSSQLCLVDLAGSERASRAGTQGTRLKEASGINSSLMNLRKCIEVLREIQSAGSNGTSVAAASRLVVPYRDKRLTHLFKSYFEGDGRVVMLICINPCMEDYDDLMHVLKFAESSQEVSTYRSVFATPASPAPPSTPLPPLSSTVSRSAKRRISATPRLTTPGLFDTENRCFIKFLANLTGYDFEIRRILSTLLAKESASSPDNGLCASAMVDSAEKAESNCETSAPGAYAVQPEDSAPEYDQLSRRRRTKGGPKGTPSSSSSLSFTENLSALKRVLIQRLEASHQATDALSRDYAAFRQHLLESGVAADRSNGESDEQIHTLKSKIRRLEANLSEQSMAADHQRQNYMHQLEHYRTEADRLRTQMVTVQTLHEETSTETISDSVSSSEQAVPVLRSSRKDRRPSSRRLRPSCSQPNLVAVLSRQWESRLAAQQSETELKRRSRHLLNLHGTTGQPASHRKAAFNARHRRSHSAGSRLLEHQEHNAVPMGTIMTPSSGGKRRKSVKQVELKDTKKATDYILHHQDADESGNLRTSLYKGTIIPTAGGGSAVIFNDVEELQQHSPCTPKSRKSRE